MKIGLEKIDTYKEVTVEALLDSCYNSVTLELIKEGNLILGLT